MSNPNETGASQQQPDAPLSPEALAALGKARRSFAVSMGILLLGFMAIAGALVYRVMRDAPPPTIAAEVSVPAAADIVSAVVSDGLVNVTYVLDGVTTLVLFDRATGEIRQSVVIARE